MWGGMAATCTGVATAKVGRMKTQDPVGTSAPQDLLAEARAGDRRKPGPLLGTDGGRSRSGRNAGGLAGETEHRAGRERNGFRSFYIYQHQHRLQEGATQHQ